jgi:PAS domain S-box-containing protein
MGIADATTRPDGETDATKEAQIRVLCVDDETSFLTSTKQILQLKGSFFVETASSVDEALQKMAQLEFDVVVSDYMMPVKSGLDFLKELRENDNEVPFILFTGQGREEVAIKALNLGADRYFNKFGHPETVYGELTYGIRQCAAQRKAEKQIWDREERLRAIIASSPDAMIVTDLKGNIVDCNIETLKLLEMSSKKDLIGTNCSCITPTENKQKMREASRKLVNEGAIQNIESKFLTKNGKTIPVEYSANILRDAYSKPIGAVVLAKNISERKKAEETLRQSETKFRKFFENTPVYCYMISPDGKILEINKSALKALGYKKEEVIGKPIISTIYAPSSQRKAKKLIEKWKNGRKIEGEELEIVTKKGKTRRIVLDVHTVRNAHGELLHSVSVQRDITDKEKADEEIRKSEEKYRGIVELSPDGIATMNMQGTVTSINRAFVELTGFSEEEIVGKHFTKLGTLKMKDIPRYVKIVSDMLRGKKVGNIEFDYYRKDGTHRLGEARIGLTKENDRTIGLQAVLTDITERKQMEQELRDSEEKHRKFIENAPDGIISLDTKGIVTQVNKAILEQTGFTEKAFLGKHFTQLAAMQANNSPDFTKQVGAFLKGEIPNTVFEFVYCCKDGTQRVAEASIGLLKQNGKQSGIQLMLRDITERKKTEINLKQSEEKLARERDTLEKVTGNLNASLVMISKDYKVLWANKYIMDKLGDIIGKTCYSGLNNLKQVCPECKINEAFASGEQVVFEQTVYQPTHPETKNLLLEITAMPIKDEKGKVTEVLELAINITKRKQMGNTLREAEEKYKSMLDTVNVLVQSVDSEGKFVYANEEWTKILGYSKEECEKLKFTDIIRSDHHSHCTEIFKQIVNGKPIRDIETVFVSKQGKEITVRGNIKPIFSNGKFVSTVGFFLDITERKKAEQALEQSEKKFRELSEMLPEIVFEANLERVLTFANEEAFNKFGYSQKELEKGMNPALFIAPEDRERAVKNLGKLMKGQEITANEYMAIRKDGTKFPVTVKSTPIVNEGKTVGIRGIMVDLSEHMKTQEKLKKTLTNLGSANEKLKVVGKLTRHDARNKLSTIANNAFLLKNQLKDNKTAIDQLTDIEVSIDQIEKIFEFTRIYEMLGTEKLTPINVKTSLKEAFMLSSRSDQVELVNECKGLTVKADSLLRQVFYNLIDNSLKHGEKVTKIRMHCKETKNKLHIIYEDNGIGIPEDQKQLIFKEGYGKGTGYGLYLLNKICEEYGWTIQETSKRGKGAKFVITVPKLDKNGKPNYSIIKEK